MKILMHDYGGYSFSYQLAKRMSLEHHVIYSFSDHQVVQRCKTEHTPTFQSLPIATRKKYGKYNLIARFFGERAYGRQLAALIDQLQPDLIITADTPLDVQTQLFKAAKKSNSKVIFWVQDIIGLAMKSVLKKKIPIMGNLLGDYYQIIEKQMIKKSDAVVLISPSFLKLMDEWKISQTKIQVIPNWAPIEDIPVLLKQNEWSIAHGLDQTINFIYTGVLGYKHDPDLFVQLAKHFKYDPRIKIVIVSQGGSVESLIIAKQSLDLSNLIILPFQPNEAYPLVLASADVLISIINQDASQYSIPSKVLSYLCAGRPILLCMNKENDAARTIESANAGFVCDPSHLEEWFEKAEMLSNNPSIREQFGRNARQYAESEFNLDSINIRFAQILSTLQ